MKSRKNIVFLGGYLLWVAAILLVLVPSTSSCTATSTAIDPQQGAQLEAFLNTKDFTFHPEYAMPLASQAYLGAANLGVGTIRGGSPTQINIQGEGYFLKIEGDSVSAFLPYFGTRDNMTDAPGGRGGIEIESELESLSVEAVRKGRQLEFFADSGYERFRFLLVATPGLQAQVSVFSPQRDVIRFSGTLSNTRN